MVARNVAALEKLFGDVDPDACTTEFSFGQDGKPFYVSGPDEPSWVGLQAMRHLKQPVGEGNSEYRVVSPDPIAAE